MKVDGLVLNLRVVVRSVFCFVFCCVFMAGVCFGNAQQGGVYSYNGPGQYKSITLGARTGTNIHSGQPITFGTYPVTVTDPGTGTVHTAGETVVFEEKWPSRIDYASVNLTTRTYDLYIPSSYNHSKPSGIVLHYNAGGGGTPPGNLLPLLDERDLIFVGATEKGNYSPTDERMAWGLIGLLRTMELLNIDVDRMYMQGGSGGSRTAHTLSFFHAELFNGVFGSVGSAYPERLPNCYETKYPNSHYETQYIGHWSDTAFRFYPRELGFRYYVITGFSDFREGDNMNVYHYGLERNGFINRLYTEPGNHGVGSTMAYKAAIDYIEHPRVDLIDDAFDNNDPAVNGGLGGGVVDLSEAGAVVDEVGGWLNLKPTSGAVASVQMADAMHWCDPYGATIRFQYKPLVNGSGVLNQKTDIGLWGKPFTVLDAQPTADYAVDDRGGLILTLTHNGAAESFSLRFIQPEHPNAALRDIVLCSGTFTVWPDDSSLWDSASWSSSVDETINTSSLDVRINAWEDQVDIVFGKHLSIGTNNYSAYICRLDDQRTLRLRFNGDEHTASVTSNYELMVSLADWIRGDQTVLTFASGAATSASEPGVAQIDNVTALYAGPLDLYDMPMFKTSPFSRGPIEATVAYSGTIAGEAFDANGDAISFAKIDGPDWLVVDPNGTIHGTPAYNHGGVNTFTVEVSDGSGLSSEGQLEISVTPDYIDPVDLSATVVAGISDNLLNYLGGVTIPPYSITPIAGPGWLTINSDGSFSGFPLAENLGNNRFDILLSNSGLPESMVALNISVTIADVLTVDTNADDDDTAAAEAELNGAGGMPGAWAVLNDATGFSLREAIWFADVLTGSDVIVFDKDSPNWASDTILLSSSQLLLSTDVEIDGGSGVVIDAGAKTFRVLEVNDGVAGTVAKVVLRNLTLQNGRLSKVVGTVNGAGIYSTEDLSLIDCVVRANAFIGGNGNWAYGVGIKTEAGSVLHLERSKVVENFSGYSRSIAGGIHASGTIRLIDSVVAYNRVNSGNKSDKGGVHIGDNSSVLIFNSSIHGNQVLEAIDPAGLFISSSASAKIISSVIADNTAGGTTSGAIDISGPATLSYCLISDAIVYGSGFTNGGANWTGESLASQSFNGTAINSGTDKGVVVYTNGVSYFTTDGGGAYTRVTSSTDVVGRSRESHSRIDIGAFEFPLGYDIVVDGSVDIQDMSAMASQWGQTGESLTADIAPGDGDGTVDLSDLAELIDHWLSTF
jgi:hypothetical protein